MSLLVTLLYELLRIFTNVLMSRIIGSRLVIVVIVIFLSPHKFFRHQSNGRRTNHCACDSYTNGNCQARGLRLIVQFSLEESGEKLNKLYIFIDTLLYLFGVSLDFYRRQSIFLYFLG